MATPRGPLPPILEKALRDAIGQPSTSFRNHYLSSGSDPILAEHANVVTYGGLRNAKFHRHAYDTYRVDAAREPQLQPGDAEDAAQVQGSEG